MWTPAESIQAGLDYLATQQAEDGGFRVTISVGGPGFPAESLTSPFVTALVLDSLAGLESRFELKSLVERSLSYLLNAMEGGGFFRFYHCDPPLRLDLDSTSVALRALKRRRVEFDYLDAAQRIRSYRNTAGCFPTWFDDRSSPIRRFLGDPVGFLRPPGNVVDPVVNANVLTFLKEVGLDAPEAEAFLVESTKGPGSIEGTPYYIHAECLAYALSKLAEMSDSRDPVGVATAAFVDRLANDQARRTPSLEPFLATRLAAASGRLRGDAPEGAQTVATVLGRQRSNGSWPEGDAWTAVRWAKGWPRPRLGSPAFETANALEVLGRCLR